LSLPHVRSLHFRYKHLFPSKEEIPLAAPLLIDSLPDLRNKIRFSESWDTGWRPHGRNEQFSVYYAASAACLPLLCLGRSQLFRQGCSGSHHKIRPYKYQPIRRPFAFNLNSRSHLNALLVCFRSLDVLYHHRDRLLREEVIREPEVWSKESPSPIPEVLCRVDLETFGLVDQEGKEPDRAEQLVEARLSWDPYHGQWAWRLELVRRGWYGDESRPVGFLDRSSSSILIRFESIPKLTAAIGHVIEHAHIAVEEHPDQARLNYSQLGQDYEQVNRQLYWNEKIYRRLIKPSLELLQLRSQDYDPNVFRPGGAEFYQHPDFERELKPSRKRRARAGMNGQNLCPLYLQRLQALEENRIQWLPSWSVDLTRALLDLRQLRRSQRVLQVLTASLLTLYSCQVEQWSYRYRRRLPPPWQAPANYHTAPCLPSSRRGREPTARRSARAPPDSS
jgi:hypothetical protein